MDLLIGQFGPGGVLVARFRRRRDFLFLVTAERRPEGGTEVLGPLLAEAAGENREETRVVLSLPPAALFLRELDLPVRDRRKARELLPLELKGETLVDGEEPVFDALPLAAGKTLAVWANGRELESTLQAITAAGVHVDAVTSSLCHWPLLLPPGETGVVALTDGSGVAVCRDGQPVLFRSLGADPARELPRTLAALELGRGVVVERILFFGGADRASLETGSSATRTVMPLPCAGMAAAFASESDARDLAAAYATARALIGGDEVRLGPRRRSAGPAELRDRRRIRISLALCGILILLLFAEAGLRYAMVRRDLDSVDASLRAAYREIFPNRKKAADEVAEVRAEIRRLTGQGGGTALLPLLKRVAEAKGDEVAGIYEFDLDRDELRLRGEARSVQGVNGLKNRLVPYLSGAEVGEIKSRPDGSVTFLLRGTVKEKLS